MSPQTGGINIVDDPPIIGHYWYLTTPYIIWNWFCNQGAVASLPETVYPLLSSRTSSWLRTKGREAANAHLKQFKDPLDSGFSLPTFVRESRELVQMLRHFLSFGKILKKLAAAFGNRSCKEIARIIGEEHLHWAFGVLPVLNDINSMAHLLANHKRIIEQLYRGHQRTFKYHYSDVVDSSMDWSGIDLGIINAGQYKGVGLPWTVHHVITMEHRCYIRYYLRAGDIIRKPHGSFLALLDLLGVNPDPQIVWDAIPFSFVVDWFTDIGENLHAMRKQWVDVDMTVVDAAHHVKVVVLRKWFGGNQSAGTAPHFTDLLTYFERERFIPTPLDSTSLPKQLGVHKILLAASLAATRGRASG